uniref:Uncharacterized protein n=1 Tax=Glossina morsitans morsitans TaxID=37546 RepID=A0A1B0FK83_GLOMM
MLLSKSTNFIPLATKPFEPNNLRHILFPHLLDSAFSYNSIHMHSYKDMVREPSAAETQPRRRHNETVHPYDGVYVLLNHYFAQMLEDIDVRTHVYGEIVRPMKTFATQITQIWLNADMISIDINSYQSSSSNSSGTLKQLKNSLEY